MTRLFLVVKNNSDSYTTEARLGNLLNELYALGIGITIVINMKDRLNMYILGSSDVYTEEDISFTYLVDKYKDSIMSSTYLAFIDDSYLEYNKVYFDESALIIDDNCVIIRTSDFHQDSTLKRSVARCRSVKLISHNKFKLFCNMLLTK